MPRGVRQGVRACFFSLFLVACGAPTPPADHPAPQPAHAGAYLPPTIEPSPQQGAHEAPLPTTGGCDGVDEDQAAALALNQCQQQMGSNALLPDSDEHVFGWSFRCDIGLREGQLPPPGYMPVVVDRSGNARFLSSSGPPQAAIAMLDEQWAAQCP